MPTIDEALRYANSPQTSADELRRAPRILHLPAGGSEEELRVRLGAHLAALDVHQPVICLNPPPLGDDVSGAGPALPRPEPGEYAETFSAEIALVPEAPDFAALLLEQLNVTRALTATFGEANADLRYAPDKWSVRETVGHLSDCERVLSYRLLRTLRGDATTLAGFDHVEFVAAGRFDRRPLHDVVGELAAAYLIAGHERHHQELLRSRYMPCLASVATDVIS